MLKEISKEDMEKVGEMLSSYWKTKGMDYSKDWAVDYISKGHSQNIKLDRFFVYKENDNMIGCVALVIYEGDAAEIKDLVIKEDYRGKGIGSKLIKRIKDIAKENDVKKLFCLSLNDNLGFYKKLGFENEAVLKDHYAQGVDVYVMSLFI